MDAETGSLLRRAGGDFLPDVQPLPPARPGAGSGVDAEADQGDAFGVAADSLRCLAAAGDRAGDRAGGGFGRSGLAGGDPGAV